MIQDCQDPFVKALKDKGYSLVAYPKTSIKPLHIYEHTVNKPFKRFFMESDAKPTSGFVKSMFTDNVSGAIGLSDGKGINIDLRKTGKINASLSAKIFGGYFQDAAPSFDMALENTKSVIFHIEEIITTDADEINLRNWLNDNQKELRAIYEPEIRKGNLFILTSLLRAKKVRMQIERKNQDKLGIDLKKIEQLPIQGELKLNSDTENNDQLVFESTDEGIVFGVRLVRLIFSGNGILTIDNKQDYVRVLGENMDLNYFSVVQDTNFIEVD
jgi:hypothetical protein